MQPTFPAVIISTNESPRPFLMACGDSQDEPTLQFRHYMIRQLQDCLVVDVTGQSLRITDVSISGISWRRLFLMGPVSGIVALVLDTLLLSIPVKVRVTYAPTSPMALPDLKSLVLARIAASTSNFMGRGSATNWQATVNTARSFSQLINRLCLQ